MMFEQSGTGKIPEDNKTLEVHSIAYATTLDYELRLSAIKPYVLSIIGRMRTLCPWRTRGLAGTIMRSLSVLCNIEWQYLETLM